VADAHDTDARRPDAGAGRTDHVVPLKCRAKPHGDTAVQFVADVHDTASSSFEVGNALGFGLATIVHFDPLKCSTRLSIVLAAK